VTVGIKGLPDSSIDSAVDFSEITMSPGETRTLSLTWDRVDLVPDYFVPGDVELCVEADRDGVPGIQDKACTTVDIARDIPGDCWCAEPGIDNLITSDIVYCFNSPTYKCEKSIGFYGTAYVVDPSASGSNRTVSSWKKVEPEESNINVGNIHHYSSGDYLLVDVYVDGRDGRSLDIVNTAGIIAFVDGEMHLASSGNADPPDSQIKQEDLSNYWWNLTTSVSVSGAQSASMSAEIYFEDAAPDRLPKSDNPLSLRGATFGDDDLPNGVELPTSGAHGVGTEQIGGDSLTCYNDEFTFP
jgi:hypothetical protein